MTPQEINMIVREVEIAYRNKMGYKNCRIRQINPGDVRAIMRENKIGMQCEKCLNKKDGRYCSPAHSDYYRKITNQTYGTSYPLDYELMRKIRLEIDEDWQNKSIEVSCVACGIKKPYPEMSSDHILPISKGGLEFDRENLQWMCLECNLRKHNHTEDEIRAKLAEEKKQTKLSDVL